MRRLMLASLVWIAALVAVHHWTNIGSDAEQKRAMALTQVQSNSCLLYTSDAADE